MRSLCSSNEAVLPPIKQFCQRIGRRQMPSPGVCCFLTKQLGMSQPMFHFQNRMVAFHIMQKILVNYLLAQGVYAAEQLYEQQVFAKAGAFASLALGSTSLFARLLAKPFFREATTHVFDALLGRLSPLTLAEAVVVCSNFHSRNMFLL